MHDGKNDQKILQNSKVIIPETQREPLFRNLDHQPRT